MSDLISRQAAIDAMFANMPGLIFNDVLRILRTLPSAQPERKAGRWERHYTRPNVFADLYWHCSVCGYKNDNQYANRYHKYCPYCGADMKGENDETD